MPDGVRRGSLADDAYSLSTTPDDEERPMAPDESTSLLGDGTASSDAGSEAEALPAGKDAWDGYEEFDGLPWHKRPSVCSLLSETELRGAVALTMTLSRFTGLYLHMPSSPWHLVGP